MPYDALIQSSTISGGSGLDVGNPATGEVLATVRDCSVEEVEAGIAAAASAMTEWAARPATDRAQLLRRWYQLILDNRDTLAELVTAECGKPLSEAAGEIVYGASFVEWFAEEGKRAYGEVIPHHAPGRRLMTLRQPVGVAAAITPWNFPVAMVTRKIAPALAAGCAILLKPAEATPLSAFALKALAVEAGLPEDIFQVFATSDPARIGKVFCDSAVIRKLSFTGSTPVGKTLLAQCAGTVKRVSMELGGNAPFIVFDDADLDAALDGAMVCKFRNAGQTCVCANRILVQNGVHDAFIDRLTERVRQLQVGDGAGEGTEIGPLINIAGRDKVERLVGEARDAGARIRTGGNCHPAGRTFFEPTVIAGVTTDMAIANTEIFGPVAPVIGFADEAEAIRIANATPYGLAAYFYARDVGRIWRVMEGLQYGMVAVNEGILSTEVAPFGGVKESGFGREGSRHGLDEYLEIKYALLGGLTR